MIKTKLILKIKKVVRFLMWLNLIIPFNIVIAFFVLVQKAKEKLGRYPLINDPHPNELGLQSYYNYLRFSYNELLSLFVVPSFLYIIICIISMRNILKLPKLYFLLVFISYALMLILQMFESHCWLYC
jgi:hypothetical protein